MKLPDIHDAVDAIESVVVVRLSRSGAVLHENAGFTRLHAESEVQPWQVFTRPGFDELAGMEPDAEGRIYAGRLTLGDPQGTMHTLTGSVYAAGDEILVVAGYDIIELERMSNMLLALNEQLDAAHRELVRANRELGKREEVIRRISVTDSLTGAGNRRRFDEDLPVELERADRHGYPLSLVIFDLDHFKHCNDTFGHEAGDRVLREVGALLSRIVRQADGFYRLGGEEFVVIMPGVDGSEAGAAAERMRRMLEDHAIDEAITITASFGVAALERGESGAALMARADAAMYEAKRNGRNQVVGPRGPVA